MGQAIGVEADLLRLPVHLPEPGLVHQTARLLEPVLPQDPLQERVHQRAHQPEPLAQVHLPAHQHQTILQQIVHQHQTDHLPVQWEAEVVL